MNSRSPGFYRFLFVILLALSLPLAVYAQTSGANLEGTVVDESGAALPGVTVTITNAETGFSRTDITGPDGLYRFGSIPVGRYNIAADLSGFGTASLGNVLTNVASTRTADLTLRAAAVEESIVVTAEAPLVADSPAIGTVVSQQELEGLPLNGRQFANLAQLAPGTTLSVNSDPTKPGQLTIALNGGSGRNVNFLIDGGDNTDDTIGGALQNFNLEAVQEFKIQTQQYKAEYGRTTGGVLTVVTKTGTNRPSGSVYGFFRNESLNAVSTTEENAGLDAQPYERNQYGASLGGPIVRDRAHFFGTYEKTDRTTQYTVNTEGIFPSLDGSSVAVPFEDELATAKGTWNLSASQYMQVRYGYQKNADKYGQSPLATPDALGTVANLYKSILGSHTAQLGGDRLNEFLYQWTRFENSITADSNSPALAFPNGVVSGQNVNAPQTTTQEKSQFKDDFSWSSTLGGDRHDFKVGLNYVHEPILGGDFTVGTNGQFTLLNNSPTSPVTDIVFTGGFSGNETPVDQYGGYVQDDWSVNDKLQVNLGFRYDLWQGFDLDQTANPIFQALRTQTTYNESYLQDFKNGDGQLTNDDDNYAPRLGFTYDLAGNGQHVVRGGWGIYYDFPYTNATILFPASAVQSNFGVVYQVTNPTGILNSDGSFFRPGQPLPPNQVIGGGAPPPNEVASPTLAAPKATQASLGYSTELTTWLGLTVDLVSIQYRDIPYRFRANGFLDANGTPTAQRRFPQFGNFRIWIGNGEADYTGLNLGFRARAGQKLQMQGFYTLSKAEGNVLAGADEFRLTAAGNQPDFHRLGRDASVNFRDPLCDACFGPLYTDARHRATFSVIYSAPFGINVSGIARYRSGFPYTLFDPTTDLNGDGFRHDLVPGVDNVNSERGDDFSQVDVRLGKEFKFTDSLGIELIAEAFNLFNADNGAAPNADGQPTTFAGDPGQGEQRLFQLGARVRF